MRENKGKQSHPLNGSASFKLSAMLTPSIFCPVFLKLTSATLKCWNVSVVIGSPPKIAPKKHLAAKLCHSGAGLRRPFSQWRSSIFPAC
jgi:hypothetical protein